jgi:hypothetical protein
LVELLAQEIVKQALTLNRPRHNPSQLRFGFAAEEAYLILFASHAIQNWRL